MIDIDIEPPQNTTTTVPQNTTTTAPEETTTTVPENTTTTVPKTTTTALQKGFIAATIVVVFFGLAILILESFYALRYGLPGKGDSPSFLDQMANNGIQWTSCFVSAVLVWFTYSLFNQTTEALSLGRSQAKSSADQAASAKEQASTAKASNETLKKQIRDQLRAHDEQMKAQTRTHEEQMAAQSRANDVAVHPFVDLSLPNIRCVHGRRLNVFQENPAQVGRLSWKDQIDNDTDAIKAAKERYPNAYFTAADALKIVIAARNSGRGPAVDMTLSVAEISWAKLEHLHLSEKFLLTEPTTVICDRIDVNEETKKLTNYSLISHSFKKPFLAPKEKWSISYDLGVSAEVYGEGADSPPSPVLGNDLLSESELFETAAFYNEKSDALEAYNHTTSDKRSCDRRPLGLGLRISISYTTLGAHNTSETPDPRDSITYNVLVSEQLQKNALSTLDCRSHLVSARSHILGLDSYTPEPSGDDCFTDCAYMSSDQGFTMAGLDVTDRVLGEFQDWVDEFGHLVYDRSALAQEPDGSAAWKAIGMSPSLRHAIPKDRLKRALDAFGSSESDAIYTNHII